MGLALNCLELMESRGKAFGAGPGRREARKNFLAASLSSGRDSGRNCPCGYWFTAAGRGTIFPSYSSKLGINTLAFLA